MSLLNTKALRQALEELQARREDAGSSDGRPKDAWADLEAIERAAKQLTEWNSPGRLTSQAEIVRHAKSGNEAFALMASIAKDAP